MPGIGVIRTGADMPTTVVEENRSTESRLIYGYLSLFILYYTPKNTDWEIIFFVRPQLPGIVRENLDTHFILCLLMHIYSTLIVGDYCTKF